MRAERCSQAWSLARRAARQARNRQSQWAAQGAGDPWRIEDLLALHGHASMAAILLVLALVTLLPVAGVGTVLSLGILTWAWAWVRNRETLPGLTRIARVPLPHALASRSLRWLARLHLARSRWLRPRLQHFQTPAWRWPWAFWVALMALIIFLPIPFGNVLPAMSLLLFGLGLMARDGVLLLLSLAPGAGGLALLLFSVHGMMIAFNFYWPPITLN
ncbi:MAG: exopolysaccharide biosynthesis protein [Limnohabitans sp.]